MKYASLFAAFLILSNNISLAAELLPAHHASCKNIDIGLCGEGSELVFTEKGKCGCLRPDEYKSPNICMSAFIVCDENAGQSFEGLYVYQHMCGFIENYRYVGCGCFTTAAP